MVIPSSYLIWQIWQFYPTAERIWLCIRLNNAVIDCHRLTEGDNFSGNKIIYSDKAFFDFGGYANKQNCCFWGTENPHTYLEEPMHLKRVTVWCRFWSRGIIGLFFLKNEPVVAVTINGNRYRAMLNEFLYTKIEKENIGNIWFQQDGATCYTAEATLEDRIISRRADVV